MRFIRRAAVCVILGLGLPLATIPAGCCALGSCATDGSEEGAPEMVEISSSDAAGHALPPASIAIDPGASGMVARTFPDKNRYLLLSGPPGGPLGVRVDAYSGTAATAEGLAQLAQQRYADDSLEKGAFADVQLAGGKRAAYSCATGTSQARAVHVLALFPASPGADRGVLLDAWIGAQKGVPGPAEVAGTGKLKDVLGSLKVRFE